MGTPDIRARAEDGEETPKTGSAPRSPPPSQAAQPPLPGRQALMNQQEIWEHITDKEAIEDDSVQNDYPSGIEVVTG